MAAMVCLVGVWSHFSQPDPPKEAILYNLIFSDVLVHSQTPREDLTELGLGEDMLRWIGTDAFDKKAPIEDPAFRESFYSQITPSSVAGFYSTHPDRALGLLDRAARQGFSLRPEYLGNFEERSGRSPGAQSASFDVWSSLRANFPSKSLAGLTFVLGMAALGGFVVWKRCGTLEAKMLAELFLLLVAMSALEFAVVCLGGGALDTVKHLFAFNLMVDMGAIMAASYVAYWWSKVVN
jgi:hypothetical protein